MPKTSVETTDAGAVIAPEMLCGRRKIFSSVDYLDENNIFEVVNDAIAWHGVNMNEEEYLFWYRRGLQPILMRTKEVRPEINHKVVNNTYNQVVVFKNGYFLTKPAYYISRKTDEQTVEQVNRLNEFLYVGGKNRADNQVVNWFHTVGIGVMYVEPDRAGSTDVPFHVYALDPRQAFVVYSTQPGNRPIFGVNMVEVNGKYRIDVFTDDVVWRLAGGSTARTVSAYRVTGLPTAFEILSVEPNVIGKIPMVEYAYNENRMAAPEAAVPLMDAYNDVESNRLDSISQFVQSLIVTYNCEFEQGTTANTIRQYGMVNLKSNGENKADIKIMSEVLNQDQTQTTLDNLYEQIMDKCGVPYSDRTGGGTSDNGSAVYLRNGWASADTDARNTEDLFYESNRYFDEIVLEILRRRVGMDLSIDDFELKIDRNSTSNLLVKTQAALNMKQLGLAPQIALERSGLSNDPLKDIDLSKDYIFKIWEAEQGGALNYAEQVTEETIDDTVNDRTADEAVEEGAEV